MKAELEKNGDHIIFSLSTEDGKVSFASFFSHLEDHPQFPSELTRILRKVPFRSFRWEHPRLTSEDLNTPYESVFIDSPELTDRPDPDSFREHFTDDPVVTFENLSGDSLMVVPTPQSELNYSHFKSFISEAPDSQIFSFFKTTGAVVSKTLQDRPVWLNTAGAGVAWLHLRLDSKPKYYRHFPYRSAE